MAKKPSGAPSMPKQKYIHPFERKVVKSLEELRGGEKRKIVEKWSKMWDSALSDLQYDRIIFEHNPDAEQKFKTKNERINDGCQKLCAIGKLNQNITTHMLKKFVSGPPKKLYTLNRIEAVQCWNRIINKDGLVRDNCCVDLPLKSGRKFNIPSLRPPKELRKKPDFLRRTSLAFRLPSSSTVTDSVTDEILGEDKVTECVPIKEKTEGKKNSPYWLDYSLVPPVAKDFREEEFEIDPKYDPTGEIRKELYNAKIIAKRYTRFAPIIERAILVIPDLVHINKAVDADIIAEDQVRRQTLLRNFFSSQKMVTEPEFKRDALYATILSRNDNPKVGDAKKVYPYTLAETAKLKSKLTS